MPAGGVVAVTARTHGRPDVAVTARPTAAGDGPICGALPPGQGHDDPMTADTGARTIDLDDDPDFERRDRVVTRVGMPLPNSSARVVTTSSATTVLAPIGRCGPY